MSRPNMHKNCRPILQSFPLVVVAVGYLVLGIHGANRAHGLDLSSIIKKIAKVSDDVNLKQLDEIAQHPDTLRAGREVFESTGRKLDDATERTRVLRQLLVNTLGDADPTLVRQLGQLDEPTQQAVLVLGRGARNLENAVADVALRGRLLQDGGGDALCAIGRYDSLVDDLIRYDAALRTGRVMPSQSGAFASLTSFGAFFNVNGERAMKFWDKYVRPHWKLWLGGSALTAVLLAPDEFLDATGELTREGLVKIGEFGGDALGSVLAGIIEGAGEGAKKAVAETGTAFFGTFFTSFSGPVALVLLLAALLLAIPFTRGWMLVRILNHLRSSRTAKKESTSNIE